MNIFKQAIAFPMYLSAIWLIWVLMKQTSVDSGAVILISFTLIAFALWLLGLGRRFIAIIILIVTIFGAVSLVKENPIKPIENEKFSISKLEKLRGENKAVFVDATADWCITCKVNEKIALSSSKVRSKFNEKNIVYLVADWTNENSEISDYLKSFGRAGVPLYVYYPTNGKEPIVLPQIITENLLLDLLK